MTIPNSVTSIGDYAFFYCCSLPSVTIPNSVTSIGYSAFSECSSLTSVTIPDSVTSIGGSAFYGCYKLENIIVDSKNANYSSIDGILYNKNATTLLFCPLPKTSVTIPNSVTSIGDDAFSKCFNLKAIYMQWVIPLACSVKFSDEVYKETVLYVPIGTMAAYEKVDPWRNFWNIEEMNFNGIDMIETDSDVSLHIYVNNGTLSINGIGSHESVTVYDMQGQIVYNGSSHTIDNLSQGLYIVKVGNQTIKISI